MYRAPSLRLSRRVAASSLVVRRLSSVIALFLLKLGELPARRHAWLWRAWLDHADRVAGPDRQDVRDAVARERILPGPTAIVIGDSAELAAYPKSELLRAYGVVEIGRFELPQGDVDDPGVLADSVARLNFAVNAARVSQADRVLTALKWSDAARYDLVRNALRALPLPGCCCPFGAGDPGAADNRGHPRWRWSCNARR